MVTVLFSFSVGNISVGSVLWNQRTILLSRYLDIIIFFFFFLFRCRVNRFVLFLFFFISYLKKHRVNSLPEALLRSSEEVYLEAEHAPFAPVTAAPKLQSELLCESLRQSRAAALLVSLRYSSCPSDAADRRALFFLLCQRPDSRADGNDWTVVTSRRSLFVDQLLLVFLLSLSLYFLFPAASEAIYYFVYLSSSFRETSIAVMPLAVHPLRSCFCIRFPFALLYNKLEKHRYSLPFTERRVSL